MKKKRFLQWGCAVLIALLAGIPLVFCAAAADVPGPLSYAPPEEGHLIPVTDGMSALDNELLLTAAPGTKPGSVAALIAPYGGRIVGRIATADEYQIRFDRRFSVPELNALSAGLERTKTADRARLRLFTAQAAQYYDVGDMWRADLADATDVSGKSWHLELLNVPAAWAFLDAYREYFYPQKVGVLDTGFWPHEDINFAEVYNLKGWGYEDNYEHGTAVTGVIGANCRNTRGIMGVYPFAEGNLLGYSYFQSVNESGEDTYFVYEYGLAWLLEHGARVINISMQDDTAVYYYYYSVILKDAALAAEQYRTFQALAADEGDFLQRYLNSGYDFLIVNAAGNKSNSQFTINVDGRDVDVYIDGYISASLNGPFGRILQEDYPDVYNRILIAGALQDADTVATFSNVGDRVDVYAPGVRIYTTSPRAGYDTPSQTGYAYYDGTSFSAPILSGIAANILSVNPWLNGDDVRDLLKYIAGPYQRQPEFPRNPDALTAVEMANDLRDELALGTRNQYGITLRPRRADVDRNGAVTAADARLALRAAVGLEDYPPYSLYFHHADTDGNGKITTGDARYILRVAVGLETLSLKY